MTRRANRPAKPRSPQERVGCFNTVTLLFLLLTVFVCLVSAGLYERIIQPPAILARKTPLMPDVAILPTSTITPTFTPSDTPTDTPTASNTPLATQSPIPPTETPIPPSATLVLSATPLPTDAPIPSDTVIPSDTAAPPDTAIPTALPTAIPSATATRVRPTATIPASATQPTATATPVFSFQAQPITFAQYSGGCAFEGITGQVYGLDKSVLKASTGILAVVTAKRKGAVPSTVTIATSPGDVWMLPVAPEVNKLSYLVQLHSPKGIALSDQVTVTFTANCAQNLATVNFAQSKPF